MMVRWLAVPTALMAALACISFSNSKVDRADFTYVNPSGIHTLDPARMSWIGDFRVALNLWEGLTTWDPQTLETIGAAAYFPPEVSNVGLTYTFHIREDSRWSNGDAVTAHDFIRGWRRAMEPGTAGDYRFFFTEHIVGAAEYVAWRNHTVTSWTGNAAPPDDATFRAYAAEMNERFQAVGVHASDDRTLVVRLIKPVPYLLDLLGFPAFLPVHASIEMMRESYQGVPITSQGLVAFRPHWTQPRGTENGYPGLITNGPYELAQWTFKRSARLRVNPFYRDAGSIGCRTVDMLEYDNVSASLMAFDSGDVDFLTDLSVPYEHELYRLSREGVRPQLKPCQTPATYFFNFNCVSSDVHGRKNPLVDPLVRRAFTLATDRASIVEKVRRRDDRIARSFVPPGAIAGYTPPNGLVFDPAAARDLLSLAGYDSGQALGPVEILYPPKQAKVSQALGRMWEENLGVEVELRMQESKTFAEEKAHQRFMIAWGNWYADYNDPTTFLNCFASGNGNNDSGYSNPEYDAMLAGASNEKDPTKRMALLQEAERFVIEGECPVLPILHPTELIAVSDRVRGISPNGRLWFPFRYVSVVP